MQVISRKATGKVYDAVIVGSGTARMGNDPKTSVLNKWNQAHDVKNLMVVDGSCFVSSGCVNPTLTILSLAMRASEYAVEQFKREEI